ncbi:MAG: DUF3631 domain-containing protein [Pseudomonadota bacterium]
MSEPTQQFRDALAVRGIVPPADILADGVIHRCDAEGRGGKGDAAYLLHLDGIPAGGFENWRDGLGWQNWRADIGRRLSTAEEAEHRAKIDAARRERESEEAERKREAREKACLLWAEILPCTAHPYLTRKGVAANGARLHRESIVLPIRDTAGVLHSLQFIGEDGGKRYLTCGRIRGCYFGIGKPDGVLCIAEGFATGASIHEATGYAVAVAFDAGNLQAAANALREKFPEFRLILCADDDYRTDGNPGMSKAKEAAQAVSGLLAIPQFGDSRPEGATDFNDLHKAQGLEAVACCINAALNGTALEQESEAIQTKPSPAEELNSSTSSDNERIEYLANLPLIEYDRQRKTQAKALGIQSATLDKMVKAARQEKTSTDGMDFDEIEPWPQPVDADTLLSELYETIKRFIICPEETAHAAALWIAMTWFMDVVQIAPLAVITAPEKRCGKSQLLFLLGRLVYRPLAASNITPAALFRAVDAWKPTLLVDEADAFMKDNEELRGLLNCGHTRESAYIVRVVGDDHTPKRFNVWGAKALAGIGQLADTLMDRAVVLELRRKLPHEQVQRLRYAEPELFERLASQLARFAQDSRDALRRSRPSLPESLNDRAQDNWEPLLAIAELAGKQWADLARRAALKLSGGGEEGGTVGNELLADIQEIFETKKLLKISTAELIESLCSDDEKAWATYNRGKPIAPRQVARKLKEYGIASKTIRIGHETAKGFEAEQFKEAFARYLSPPSENAVLSVTPSQASSSNAYSVTDYPQRYGSEKLSDTLQVLPILGCDAVTDKFGESQDSEIVEVEL